MPFHDTHFTAKKLAKRLSLIEPLQYRHKYPIAPFRIKIIDDPMQQPSVEGVSEATTWPEIPPQTYWGEPDVNFWLYGEFEVPPNFSHIGPIALYLPLGMAGEFSHPEALIYVDGVSYSTVDRHHQEVRLAAEHCDGTSHQLWLHGWTGSAASVLGLAYRQLLMNACYVVEIDPSTRQLVITARNALLAADLLEDANPIKDRLYNALDAAFRILDTREPFEEAFYASVSMAQAALDAGIAAAGPSLDVDVVAVGHAHIDVAWLWTLAQTVQKSARTFHTVLRLMEQFPSYHFSQSQPQLYAYMAEHYPHVLEAIRVRVAEGRWEPIGGMWVEADCNISGSESLARQFLLGRSYFRQQFGPEAESPVLWLPDVFGYAWNLPQLIKLAGLEYFFTIKIGWNQYNQLPYDSFWWQGLDGTKVLTHFSTTPEHPWVGYPERDNLMRSATYNAQLDAFSALGSWVRLQHKEAQKVLLMSYGWGDGGGGPTREMNENAQSLQDFPGIPRVQQGKVIDFFRRLEAESGDRLPTWNAELYLEFHRGTYTTQSRNKRANRKSEFALHDAEFLATVANRLDSDYVYPHDALRKAWELVCLNQFHDIIPGSSIHEVYVDSQAQYQEVFRIAALVRDDAIAVVKRQVGGDVVVINPTSFRRNALVFVAGEVPIGKCLMQDDQIIPIQLVDGGFLAAVSGIKPYAAVPLRWEDGQPSLPMFTVGVQSAPIVLENNFLRVEFNPAGDIIRIYDKVAKRDVLPPDTIANQFQAFEDRPLNWDAWDIDIFYDDKLFLAEPAERITVVEVGPLRATLEIKRRILNSTYVQRISLTHNSPRLDLSTEIDWRERHILLKTAFPVDLLAPTATYEVQWGYVERPTHRSTSWDWARFETVAQKWVDLSEDDFGVALINDCKYGHDIHDNVIRLSLLRAPTLPDPEADQGHHQFSYGLLVHGHAAGSRFAEVIEQAYGFNDPLIAVMGTQSAEAKPLVAVTVNGHAVIETIKQAEDGNGIIVRLYEASRRRETAILKVPWPLKSATITNLLEDDQQSLDIQNNEVRIDLTPFQIVTVRLVI